MDLLSRRRLLQLSLLGSAGLSLSACGTASTSTDGTSSSDDVTTTGTATPVPSPTPTTTPTFSWKRLSIGAGGYVTGLDVAVDGTKICRCDSSGAYIWRTDRWVPLTSIKSMPAGLWGRDVGGAIGTFEAVIAPSKTTTIYIVVAGYVLRSDDQGATFQKTGLPQLTANASSDWRTQGRKMAVHPNDPLTVVVGGDTGLSYLTRDGGATWTALAIPAAAQHGFRFAFAGSTLYAASHGSGVFVSHDLSTFTPTVGGPTDVLHMVVDTSGVTWATDGALWRLSGLTWVQVLTSASHKSIAVDRTRAGHLVVGTGGGSIQRSLDGGATWSGDLGIPTRTATDIPWLAWANEAYMSSGESAFDADGSLWFAEGIGVWRAELAAQPGPVTFASRSLGIEQLTSSAFLKPPGGSLLYLAWDRPVFKLDDPTKFPSTYGPNGKYSIVAGWSADYAPEDTHFIVMLANWANIEQSSTSTDGGATWTQLPSMPAELTSGGKIGGSIAVASKTNYVVCPNNNGFPYFTKDAGVTWRPCSLPGVPAEGAAESGFGWAYYFHRHVVVAEKTTPGTFYIFNYLTGVYRSTDGGATFNKMCDAFSGNDWTTFHAKLSAVPGKAGHLFFTSGDQNVYLKRSIDGGTSWAYSKHASHVDAIGYGAPMSGGGYPSIFIAGLVDGIYGLYRSNDEGETWTTLGDYPLDQGDNIVNIAGDPDVYGRVYVALGGSGAVYGEIA